VRDRYGDWFLSEIQTESDAGGDPPARKDLSAAVRSGPRIHRAAFYQLLDKDGNGRHHLFNEKLGE